MLSLSENTKADKLANQIEGHTKITKANDVGRLYNI